MTSQVLFYMIDDYMISFELNVPKRLNIFKSDGLGKNNNKNIAENFSGYPIKIPDLTVVI